MNIELDNLDKIRISGYKESLQKKEVVKLILVMKLMEKYSRRKITIKIYTKFELDNGEIVDIYLEDIKIKEVYIFEILNNPKENWIKRRETKFNNIKIPFIDKVKWIPVTLNELSNDIVSLNKQLNKYLILK